MADEKNTCDDCGERMDELDDCLHSNDGRHHSVYNAKRRHARFRARLAASSLGD